MHGPAALALFLQEAGDGFLSRGAGQAAEGPGIHQGAFVFIRGGKALRLQFLPRGLDHHFDGQTIFLGELKVPLVVGRHRHHRAGAVFHEHEVGHVDGHLPAGHRVQAITAGEDPFLGNLLQHPPAPVLGPPVVHEITHRGFLRGALGQGQGQGVLRGQAHEGRAPKGVLAGGEDLNGLTPIF